MPLSFADENVDPPSGKLDNSALPLVHVFGDEFAMKEYCCEIYGWVSQNSKREEKREDDISLSLFGVSLKLSDNSVGSRVVCIEVTDPVLHDVFET